MTRWCVVAPGHRRRRLRRRTAVPDGRV